MHDHVFTANSPLGVTVYCSNDTWYNHIVAGHSPMTDKQTEVKYAIENPLCVYQSKSHPENRDVYFAHNLPYDEYTKVVVENYDTHSEVVSAWGQPEIKGNIGGLKYVKPKL